MKTWRRPYFERVLAFFKGDVEKTHLWYVLSNPHFGYVSPADIVAMGMEHKLKRMIDEAERANAAGILHLDVETSSTAEGSR
jgi:hypothetical protein